jgi:hypothetical protein
MHEPLGAFMSTLAQCHTKTHAMEVALTNRRSKLRAPAHRTCPAIAESSKGKTARRIGKVSTAI